MSKQCSYTYSDITYSFLLTVLLYLSTSVITSRECAHVQLYMWCLFSPLLWSHLKVHLSVFCWTLISWYSCEKGQLTEVCRPKQTHFQSCSVKILIVMWLTDKISVLLLLFLNNVSAIMVIAYFTFPPSVKGFLCFVQMCATVNEAAALRFFVGLVNRDCCLWTVVFSSFIFSFPRLLPAVKFRLHRRADIHIYHLPLWNKTLFPTLHKNCMF